MLEGIDEGGRRWNGSHPENDPGSMGLGLTSPDICPIPPDKCVAPPLRPPPSQPLNDYLKISAALGSATHLFCLIAPPNGAPPLSFQSDYQYRNHLFKEGMKNRSDSPI